MAGVWTLWGRWRLIPVAAGAGAAALILAGALAGLFADDLYRAQKTREVTMQARVVAASVSAALAFDDRAMEAQFIGALRANPEVKFAGLYDDRGRLVASYQRQDARASAQTVEVSVPVVESGARLGSVRLQTELEPVVRRLIRYSLVAVLVGMAALLMSGLAAAQTVLRRANQQLARSNQALRDEISHREQIEETLRQGQKMEAIGRLTGGVAHDFNNLLMIASSGLELMDRTEDPVRRKELKEGIRQAVDRGAGLTRQLLAFSRRSPLHPEVVSLPGRIEGMRVLLERSLREDVGVDFDIDPELWPVEVDPGQLELAILNLAVNARDAMPQGGRVTIQARNLPNYSDAVLSGDLVRLSVGDQGVGMSPETMSRVFEPFFTTKGAGQGTGLGLSQVYGFIKSSGGDVRLESRLGEGTTVSLLLPRSRAPLTVATPHAAAETAPAGTSGAALLVEDDDGVAAMVTGMLQELGWTVDRARDADEALRRLDTGKPFDLLFTDTVMPGAMNGMELAREVGRRRPGLPVLVTTGYSEAASAAMRDGLRLLVKPYNLAALSAELKALLSDARRAQAS